MDLLKLFRLIGKLKFEKRKGWIQKGISSEIESVADHSFRTAIIILFLEDYWKKLGLDHERMLKMALIHDLPEAIIGDITPRDKVSNKKEQEKQAMNEIITLSDEFKSLKYIWEDLFYEKSKEAKLIWQVDKLEMALQAMDYGAKKNPEIYSEFFLSVENKLFEPKLKEIYGFLKKNDR